MRPAPFTGMIACGGRSGDVAMDEWSWERLGAAELLARLASSESTGMRHLRLHGSQLTPAVVRAIEASPAAPTVEGLHLGGNPYFRGSKLVSGVLDDAGLAALAGSPRLSAVTELWIGSNRITDAGLGALARSPMAPRLSTLAVGDNPRVTGTGLGTLVRSPRLAQLRSLNVHGGAPGLLSALTGAPWIHRCTSLHAARCGIGDTDLRALEAIVRVGPDCEINLADNAIGNLGAVALSEWPGLATVTVLDLRDNRIGKVGLASLIKSPYRRALRRIGLTGNEAILAPEVFTDWDGSYCHQGTDEEAAAALAVRFGEGVTVV